MTPPEVSWGQPGFSGTVVSQTETQQNTIIVTQKTDLDPVLIRISDYMSVREIEQTLRHPSSHTVMFTTAKP